MKHILSLNNILQLTTFLKFRPVSSIYLNPLTALIGIFLFRCSPYKYEFCKIYYCMKKLKFDDICC